MKKSVKRVSIAAGMVVGTVLVTRSFACFSSIMDGVHFKGLPVDYGSPPSRYSLYYNDSGALAGPVPRAGTTYLIGSTYEQRQQDEKGEATREKEWVATIREGERLEQAADFAKALAVWRKAWAKGLGDAGKLRPRVELLAYLVKHPHEQGAVRLLAAISIQKPSTIPVSALALALRPFALYDQAMRNADPHSAALSFWKVAQEYPNSTLAEPSLIMVPRLLLGSDAKKPAPNPSHADREMARMALTVLNRRHPHSRFTDDSMGWQARLDYLAGDYEGAIRKYRVLYKLKAESEAIDHPFESILLCHIRLGSHADVAADHLLRYGIAEHELKAYSSQQLGRTIESFKAGDAPKFWGILRHNPRLLSFYLDYRMEMTEPTRDLLALSQRGQVSSRYRGHINARLSEAAYHLGDLLAARRLAGQTLKVASDPDDIAIATFVQASIARRSGRYEVARQAYERIVSRHADSYLVGGARENLAIVYERQHRLGDALDQYRKLNYRTDVAYLIDARMSPSELSAYIAGHPRDKEIALLRYSLGFRYLRLEKWAQAEQQFAWLSAKQRHNFQQHIGTYFYDSGQATARQYDPLETAQSLAHMDADYRRNPSAKGLLAEAKYYSNHRDLLLYNSALWEGDRANSIAYSWSGSVATPADDRALEKHHWDHECFSHALLKVRALLTKFPKAPERFEAAYLGACAAERLSNMNTYWRWVDSRKDLKGESVRLMRVAAESPDAKLAAKAKKFAGVFKDEREESRLAWQQNKRASRARYSSN